jgi:hypothetical protein
LVGGIALNLPPPTGYCELSEADPGDAHMLSALGSILGTGGNRLLAVSADCRQLDDSTSCDATWLPWRLQIAVDGDGR